LALHAAKSPVRVTSSGHGLFQGGKKSEALKGEDDQRAAFAKLIQQRHRLPSRLPKMGEVIEL
jgi:hypothetical protein